MNIIIGEKIILIYYLKKITYKEMIIHFIIHYHLIIHLLNKELFILHQIIHILILIYNNLYQQIILIKMKIL